MTPSSLNPALLQAGIDPASALPSSAIDRGCFFYPLTRERATMAWQSLRENAAATGFWPLIFPNQETLEDFLEELADSPTFEPATLLEQASALQPETLFQKRSKEQRLAGAPDLGQWPNEPEPPSSTAPVQDVLKISSIPSEAPPRPVVLALVPTAEPWAVFAHLPFGSWKDCPSPAEHIALLRHWQREYGAEPAALARDSLECYVSRPPTNRTAALALAKELEAYAPDILGQGSLRELAHALIQARSWFFRWD